MERTSYRPPRRSLKQLGESISQFRSSYNLRRKENYDRVRVIHVTWDSDHQPDFIPTQLAQSRELERTFRELYKYETKRVVLPYDAEVAAYDMLAAAIREDTEQLTKDDLLILHYQGHGEYTTHYKFDSSNQGEEPEWQFSQRLAASYMKPSEGTAESTVEWKAFDFTRLRENYIDNAAPHVLMLMDCCHAPAVPCGPRSGRELLAASATGLGHRRGNPGKASWGECSFTNNVNNILKHAYEKGHMLPVSELYVRLYGNFWTRKDIGSDVRKLETEPVHMLLREGSQTPIILAPLGLVSKYMDVIDVLRDTRLPTVRADCFVTDDSFDYYDVQHYPDFESHLFENIKAFESHLFANIKANKVSRTGSLAYAIELEISLSTWYRVSHHPDLQFRYVKGPKQLNPPDFSFYLWTDNPNPLTIRPKDAK